MCPPHDPLASRSRTIGAWWQAAACLSALVLACNAARAQPANTPVTTLPFVTRVEQLENRANLLEEDVGEIRETERQNHSDMVRAFESLRSDVATAPRPTAWYKDVSSVVSLIALVTSLVASWFSFTQMSARNRAADREELRDIISELGSLPRRQLEAEALCQADPVAVVAVRSSFFAERVVVAGQGAAVAQRIPEDLTAAECYVIGEALTAVGHFDQAKSLLERGRSKAGANIVDELAIIRTLAYLQFCLGAPEIGRQHFDEALSATRRKFGDSSSPHRAWHDCQTHMNCAHAELSLLNYQSARSQLAAVWECLEALPQVESRMPFEPQYWALVKRVDLADPKPGPPTS